MVATLIERLPSPLPERRGWPWAAPGQINREVIGDHLPRITIVTPSFNQGKFLEETIRSVLLQGYPDLEYLVVDGASSDESPGILRRYSPWLSWYVSEPDRGQPHAINKGFARASGELFGFINSDDILEPGALFALARAFAERRARRTLLCGGVTLQHPEQSSAPVYTYRLDNLRIWFDDEQRVPQQGCFWSREVWQHCGPMPEALHLTFDRWFLARVVALRGLEFIAVDKPIARFRLHPASKTGLYIERFRTEWLDAKAALERELTLRSRLELSWLRFRFRLVKSAEDLAGKTLEHSTGAARLRSLAAGCARDPALLLARPFWGALRRTLVAALVGDVSSKGNTN